jgi:simple sugar transport system ATP-binding protein
MLDLQTTKSLAAPTDALALEMRGITKTFGTIEALRGVDLQLRRGELLALLGDNGAGKSTLTKVLSGAVIPDSGEIRVNGEHVVIHGPEDAHRLGIEMIYQDLALFNNLDVAENIFLGRERRTRLPFLDRKRMWREAAEILRGMHVDIPSTRLLVQNMSGGQRQMIAAARAVAFESRILVMDEPTAALGVSEAEALLTLIAHLKGAHSIILITQRLPDAIALSDRIMVLKHGLSHGVLETASTTIDDIATLIVRGRETVVTPAG